MVSLICNIQIINNVQNKRKIIEYSRRKRGYKMESVGREWRVGDEERNQDVICTYQHRTWAVNTYAGVYQNNRSSYN